MAIIWKKSQGKNYSHSEGAAAADTLEAEERAFRATDEDLTNESETSSPTTTYVSAFASTVKANTSETMAITNEHPYHFVPLLMAGNGRTHAPTPKSSALIDEIGGLSTLYAMTRSFYEKAFRDVTLDKFIRSHDDPHASRFACWIHQKLVASSSVWDKDRDNRSRSPVTVANGHTTVVHDRSSAHVAAWYSPKRDPNEVGRHFKLDECRVWMRLHFWAMREVVGDTSPSFTDYYVRFIGHFVSVYEGTAPAFARDSYRWSEKQSNIQSYIDSGCSMEDVLGLTLGQALAQIPNDEAKDTAWPYEVRSL